MRCPICAVVVESGTPSRCDCGTCGATEWSEWSRHTPETIGLLAERWLAGAPLGFAPLDLDGALRQRGWERVSVGDGPRLWREPGQLDLFGAGREVRYPATVTHDAWRAAALFALGTVALAGRESIKELLAELRAWPHGGDDDAEA